MKKGIKRNLVKNFRKSVSKLMVTQKILLATLTLLKSLYSKLNPTLSHISHYIHQFKTKSKTIFSNMSQLGYLLKTKAITTISYLVQFKYQLKKRKYKRSDDLSYRHFKGFCPCIFSICCSSPCGPPQ